MSKDLIDEVFTYHDNPESIPRYIEIREAAKTFARVVARNCPEGHDQRRALNFIRSAVMWANAAIALDGKAL